MEIAPKCTVSCSVTIRAGAGSIGSPFLPSPGEKGGTKMLFPSEEITELPAMEAEEDATPEDRPSDPPKSSTPPLDRVSEVGIPTKYS
jgi:hypothetical protein